jgi:hypothetical protein
VAAAAAGFGVRLEVELANDDAGFPTAALAFAAFDPGFGAVVLKPAS